MLTQLKRLIPVVGTAALLAVPGSALAQQTATTVQTSQRHEGFGIGAKIGPLFSSLSSADISSFKSRTGVIGGLFLGGNRPGAVGVGVDLLYARKGSKIEDFDETVNLDYINVPVYLRINAGSSSTSGAIGYGIVGVDLNFLLKAKEDMDGESEDITDDFNRADYGLALGFGVEITRFIIEGRYTKGLGNLAKDKDDPVVKTQSFAIMFGVRFN